MKHLKKGLKKPLPVQAQRGDFHVFVGSDVPARYAAARKFSKTVMVVDDLSTYPTEFVHVAQGFRARGLKVAVITNNPLFVNECKAHEVTLVAVDENGQTVETLFCDLPGWDAARKVYLVGEYWVNHATGGEEIPLRTGTPRTE